MVNKNKKIKGKIIEEKEKIIKLKKEILRIKSEIDQLKNKKALRELETFLKYLT